MKNRIALIVLGGVLSLFIVNVFVCAGFSTLGEHGAELYFYWRASQNGLAMRVTPFRKIEIWPIGPNVHGGMVDSPTMFKIGR